jgi:mono/diheme cytochrome c family protein
VLLALTSNQKLGLALAGGAFVVFALVSALLVPRYRPDFPARYLGWFLGLAVLFTVGMLATVIFVAKEEEEHESAAPGETQPSETQPTETQPAPTETEPQRGNATAGAKIFVGTAACAGCHTLKAAGSTGTIGPNLDEAKPSYDLVVMRVTEGKSPMPSFKDKLTPEQIQDVAAYVSSSAGS